MMEPGMIQPEIMMQPGMMKIDGMCSALTGHRKPAQGQRANASAALG